MSISTKKSFTLITISLASILFSSHAFAGCGNSFGCCWGHHDTSKCEKIGGPSLDVTYKMLVSNKTDKPAQIACTKLGIAGQPSSSIANENCSFTNKKQVDLLGAGQSTTLTFTSGTLKTYVIQVAQNETSTRDPQGPTSYAGFNLEIAQNGSIYNIPKIFTNVSYERLSSCDAENYAGMSFYAQMQINYSSTAFSNPFTSLISPKNKDGVDCSVEEAAYWHRSYISTNTIYQNKASGLTVTLSPTTGSAKGSKIPEKSWLGWAGGNPVGTTVTNPMAFNLNQNVILTNTKED